VRELDDARDVRLRADGVRGRRERNDARPRRELRREIVEIEREVVVHVRVPDDDPDVLGEREPRRDVRVVVEPREQHLVSRLELARERAREEEVHGRHARPERDLPRVAAQERRRALVRLGDERVRAPRRLVGRADVRVVRPQVVGDRVDHLVGALGPAGPVEEREPAIERGEPRADGVDVEDRGAHATLQS
jgi:hypothetical protein